MHKPIEQHRVIMTHVQYPAFSLVECHEIGYYYYRKAAAANKLILRRANAGSWEPMTWKAYVYLIQLPV